MVRRSTPQKKIDERAFPVRIRVLVPPSGLGQQLNHVHDWLHAEIGRGQFAVHSCSGIGADAVGIYLRDIEGARFLLEAFPTLELQDGTDSPHYSSPSQTPGEELFSVCNLYYAALPIMPMYGGICLRFPNHQAKNIGIIQPCLTQLNRT